MSPYNDTVNRVACWYTIIYALLRVVIAGYGALNILLVLGRWRREEREGDSVVGVEGLGERDGVGKGGVVG